MNNKNKETHKAADAILTMLRVELRKDARKRQTSTEVTAAYQHFLNSKELKKLGEFEVVPPRVHRRIGNQLGENKGLNTDDATSLIPLALMRSRAHCRSSVTVDKKSEMAIKINATFAACASVGRWVVNSPVTIMGILANVALGITRSPTAVIGIFATVTVGGLLHYFGTSSEPSTGIEPSYLGAPGVPDHKGTAPLSPVPMPPSTWQSTTATSKKADSKNMKAADMPAGAQPTLRGTGVTSGELGPDGSLSTEVIVTAVTTPPPSSSTAMLTPIQKDKNSCQCEHVPNWPNRSDPFIGSPAEPQTPFGNVGAIFNAIVSKVVARITPTSQRGK